MIIVKIDRNSIVKNPNAGNTHTRIHGLTEVMFSGNFPLPTSLIDGENIYLTSWTDTTYEAILINPSDISIIANTPGISYESRSNVVTYDHMPEAAYFYKYENIEVHCKQCNHAEKLRDIDDDCDDEGNYFTICKNCGDVNSFPYMEYERIDDALKELHIE